MKTNRLYIFTNAHMLLTFLSSVYVSPLTSPCFSEDYLQSLRTILVFDINNFVYLQQNKNPKSKTCYTSCISTTHEFESKNSFS